MDPKESQKLPKNSDKVSYHHLRPATTIRGQFSTFSQSPAIVASQRPLAKSSTRKK